ncbi:MAG: hypothetical protein HC861_09190 [Rhodospirillaceae bacterium]|nr:hypothetical protein [Rhodospirillaceae bacterium]
MSHELRTPLNAIIGFSDMMALAIHGPMGAPAYEQYAADINGSAKHLLSIINDILDIAKIEPAARPDRGRDADRQPVRRCDAPDARTRQRAADRSALRSRPQPAPCHDRPARHAPGAAEPAVQRHQVHPRRRRGHAARAAVDG